MKKILFTVIALCLFGTSYSQVASKQTNLNTTGNSYTFTVDGKPHVKWIKLTVQLSSANDTLSFRRIDSKGGESYIGAKDLYTEDYVQVATGDVLRRTYFFLWDWRPVGLKVIATAISDTTALLFEGWDE